MSYTVLRGGSRFNSPLFCRVSYRLRNVPDFSYDFIGFRPVIQTNRLVRGGLRGGAWNGKFQPFDCRVFFRGWDFASLSTDFVGFRPIVTLHELLNRHD